MDIINHLIDDKEIIGISPIYRTRVGHYVGPFTLNFTVYTKQQQIVITSDAYSFSRDLTTIDEAKEEFVSLTFQMQYVEAYKAIWTRLGHNVDNLPKYILKLERDITDRREAVHQWLLTKKNPVNENKN